MPRKSREFKRPAHRLHCLDCREGFGPNDRTSVKFCNKCYWIKVKEKREATDRAFGESDIWLSKPILRGTS